MAAGVFLSVSEFAKFSRTTRYTLLHYDRMGLLSPVSRGDNNYRYYSSSQLAAVNVIRTLQELGISLREIKKLRDRRTPKLAEKGLTSQIGKINRKIEDWERAKKLLLTLQNTIASVADTDESETAIKYMPEAPIVLGEPNDYGSGKNDYDALMGFYHSIGEKHPEMDLNYPVWAIFSKDRVKNGDWVWPDRYYFYNPEGGDRRPAGLYAVGYTRGGYGQNGELYKRLTGYIESSGFEICGDAYEEYPLNEVCIAEDNNYLIRVMIAVREKIK